jgi:primase-polymerase (primpol)-like protein
MSIEQTRAERYSTYAETLSKRFQTGILATMQEKPFWVLWKPEKDERGNIHKRPFSPQNYPTSMYKPRQWASLDNVLEALATGNFAGIGVMLPAPFVLLDKDATPDAPIYQREANKIAHPLALRLLEQVPSYAELSPNNGLHIIIEGRPTRGNFKTPELEMYTNWFSTVTTRHIPGTPFDVTNQQQAIQALENEFHPPISERKAQNTVGGVVASRLSALPPEASNHRRLQELLSGDLRSVGNDRHLADWNALMMILHWTGDDIALTREIFLASPLGQRAKVWDEQGIGRRGQESYLDRTIRRILEKRRNPPQRRYI